MLNERVRAGLTAGVVAAAATAGAVVGFGVRDGALAQPFIGAGRLLLGIAASEDSGRQAAAFAAGVLSHFAASVAWAVAFAIVAAQLRGVRLLVVALLFTAVVYAAREWMPPLLRVGHGVRVFPPQLVVLHVVLALALAAGIRLAQVSGRTGATPRQRELGDGLEELGDLQHLQRDPPGGGLEQ